jgi:hypothetical protein
MLFNGPATTTTFTRETNPSNFISMWSNSSGSSLFKRHREISVIFNCRRFSDNRGYSWSDHIPNFVLNDKEIMEGLADD